jgi:N4-gp56 family major capsid protein
MPNALTGGATGAAWDLLVEAAFDRAVEYYLRDEPQWRQLIDKRPVAQAMPGDTVTLTRHDTPMALATTPLTETVDVTSVALPTPTRVQVTLNEYGNAAITTLRLRELAFTKPDPESAELLGRNMYDTVDQLIRAVADAGTNILFVNAGVMKTSGGALASVAATDLLLRNPATAAVKLLQRAKVMPKDGNKYLAVVHSDTSYDLQAENSATAWNAPHTVGGDTSAIYSGEIGTFQGARYIETTRTNIQTGAGAAGANVYSTYFFGRGALVEASAVDFHTVVGPQTDLLRRFFPLGWYGMAGWGIYRPQALVTVKTGCSIATL